jgi:hypothetical protein
MRLAAHVLCLVVVVGEDGVERIEILSECRAVAVFGVEESLERRGVRDDVARERVEVGELCRVRHVLAPSAIELVFDQGEVRVVVEKLVVERAQLPGGEEVR